jgi:hypothetical protein
MSYPILFGNMAGQGSLDGLTAASAAPSAQFLYDNGVRTDGVYWITHPTAGAKQTYCEFRNNEGWMLVMNIKSDYYGDTNLTWLDNANWRQDGSNVGSVSNPFSGTGQYRDRDLFRYYLINKVMIKVHNNNTMFGAGSWVAFELLSGYQNNTFKNLFQTSGGCSGGTQISNQWYAQQGMATSGNIGSTTGFATNLDYCPIARAIGPNGHLRTNHVCGNNGTRLLASYQGLENSNQDITRGLSNHFCLTEPASADTTSWSGGCAYNSTVFAWCNSTGNNNGGSGNFTSGRAQFTNGTYPDQTNNQARDNASPYSGPYYHYGLYVK